MCQASNEFQAVHLELVKLALPPQFENLSPKRVCKVTVSHYDGRTRVTTYGVTTNKDDKVKTITEAVRKVCFVTSSTAEPFLPLAEVQQVDCSRELLVVDAEAALSLQVAPVSSDETLVPLTVGNQGYSTGYLKDDRVFPHERHSSMQLHMARVRRTGWLASDESKPAERKEPRFAVVSHQGAQTLVGNFSPQVNWAGRSPLVALLNTATL